MINTKILNAATRNGAPKSAKGRATRVRIVNEAMRQLESTPLAAVTPSTVMNELPMAKSTFYEHFESVSDIAEIMLDDFISDWENRDLSWYILDNDLPYHLYKTMKNIASLGFKKSHYLRAAREAGFWGSETNRFKSFRKQVTEMIARNLQRQQEKDLVRRNFCPTAEAYMMFDLNCAVVQNEFETDVWPDAESAGNRLAKHWVYYFYGIHLEDLLADFNIA